MQLLRFALASLAVLALSSCGDPMDGADSGTGPDAPISLTIDAAAEPDAPPDAWARDAGPPVNPAELVDVECQARARIACSALWDCGCRSTDRPDMTSCLASERESCLVERARSPEDPFVVGLASGRIRVDLARYRECWESLETSFGRCSASPYDPRTYCPEALYEDVELGGECSVPLGQACADGSGVCGRRERQCVMAATAGLPCGAGCASGLVCTADTCVAPGGTGTTCESDRGCADGLACSGGTCRAIVTAGERCADSADCAAGLSCVGSVCTDARTDVCANDSECGGFEGCLASETQRVCRPQLALGEACESDDACADGRCFRGTDTCAPRLGPGAIPCFTDFDCADGLYCSDFGSCQVLARSGEACSRGRYSSGCVPGLACIDEGMGATCVPPRELGETCATGDCGETRWCSSFSMTCEELYDEGAPCVADLCRSDLFCRTDPMTSDRYCRPLLPVGEPCDDGYGCTDGAFCRREVIARTCQPLVCEALSAL